MLPRPPPYTSGTFQSSQSSDGPQFHVLLSVLLEHECGSRIFVLLDKGARKDAASKCTGRKFSQGASPISPSPCTSLFFTLLVFATHTDHNTGRWGITNHIIPYVFHELKSRRKSNGGISARLTLLFTCCVTLSKVIHLTNIYWAYTTNTLVGGKLTKINVQFLPSKREILRKKERKEELTPINRHLFVANRPSGMLSEICGSAKVAPPSTWCGSHFL